ncbi:hypothetical protein BX600DRAFT_509768 [Xylariales sp. PMI_506]|nr:hypothetical protein BX600DRAFT_509768 [Xylariales sp. PMI_506]
MDVTSMLNSASAANREARESADLTPTPSVADGSTACSSVVQTPSPKTTPSRRLSEAQTPNRSRTPWDAGGYSLPLTLDTKTAVQISARPAFYSDSPIDSASPKSPRHRFSDSYSSLSSYTSSMTSYAHSRLSSISTLGGLQTVQSLFTDLPALDSRSCDNLDSAVSRTSLQDFSMKKTRKDGVVSPTTIMEEVPVLDIRRPGSPSDAMLISRGSQSSGQNSPQEGVSPSETRPPPNSLAPPDMSRSHKRAVSAPDFAALNASNQTYPPLPQMIQPTPSPLQHGDRRPSYAMEAPSTSPAPASLPALEQGIKCMYVDNCDTGSSPRKAISHIFGRNKLCTRMIPQHVWVHFCRKHYQRSRYRNAQEYAKLQCELVQKQVLRVQAWSDENKRAGQAGVVQDWSLSVRKREQKRLDDQASTGKKRPFREESEEDDENSDRAVLNGTAVPAWLLSKCNSGYSTAQIEEIVAQLKLEMDQGKLTQIPDIEILPNISTDPTEDGKSKLVLKRKTSGANAHKRSQSVGVGLHGTTPMMRRISQSNYMGGWRPEDALHSSPIEKRQRISDFPPYAIEDRYSHMGQPQPPSERPMRRIQQLPHRPAFGHIRENETEVYYEETVSRPANYNFGGPLPSLHRPGQPVSAPLESSTPVQSYMEARRPVHQRSHSEMGGLSHNSSFTFRSPPPTLGGYSGAPQGQGYGAEHINYEGNCSRQQPPQYASGGPPGYYDEAPAGRQYSFEQAWPSHAAPHPSAFSQPVRHGRHLSTSAVPHTIPRIYPGEHDMHSYRPAGPFEPQQTLHRRQASYNPRPVGYRIEETEQS